MTFRLWLFSITIAIVTDFISSDICSLVSKYVIVENQRFVRSHLYTVQKPLDLIRTASLVLI